MFLARIFISPKPTVNDPEGLTIQGALRQLGFDTIASVRAGKYMEVRLDEGNEAAAAEKVREMCDKLLANPVIEDYRFELERVDDNPGR
jgi:phosphoribosylformylglycinamidine synthase